MAANLIELSVNTSVEEKTLISKTNDNLTSPPTIGLETAGIEGDIVLPEMYTEENCEIDIIKKNGFTYVYVILTTIVTEKMTHDEYMKKMGLVSAPKSTEVDSGISYADIAKKNVVESTKQDAQPVEKPVKQDAQPVKKPVKKPAELVSPLSMEKSYPSSQMDDKSYEIIKTRMKKLYVYADKLKKDKNVTFNASKKIEELKKVAETGKCEGDMRPCNAMEELGKCNNSFCGFIHDSMRKSSVYEKRLNYVTRELQFIKDKILVLTVAYMAKPENCFNSVRSLVGLIRSVGNGCKIDDVFNRFILHGCYGCTYSECKLNHVNPPCTSSSDCDRYHLDCRFKHDAPWTCENVIIVDEHQHAENVIIVDEHQHAENPYKNHTFLSRDGESISWAEMTD